MGVHFQAPNPAKFVTCVMKEWIAETGASTRAVVCDAVENEPNCVMTAAAALSKVSAVKKTAQEHVVK